MLLWSDARIHLLMYLAEKGSYVYKKQLLLVTFSSSIKMRTLIKSVVPMRNRNLDTRTRDASTQRDELVRTLEETIYKARSS